MSTSTAPPVAPAMPVPAYPDAATQALSERLVDARARRQKLRDVGLSTDQLDREIVQLRRQLREGGQLRAGDALGNGRYLLVRTVGRGGFAMVWDAYDCTGQRHVAIKVLHANLAGDPVRRERFFRGAQAMRNLAHPAVVSVLDPDGEDGGFYYFVMELLPGGNLHEAVLGGRLAKAAALPLLLRVSEVVAKAHAKGMVHRDIKPANILLDGEGNPKLTDFDLVGAADTTGGTRTGALGTVVYASPECLEKPQEATARADVFGLGMTALFCLSGQDLSMAVFRNPEPLIAKLDCGEQVKQVLRQAVAWEPGDRFPDAAELGRALRGAMEAPSKVERERSETAEARANPASQGGEVRKSLVPSRTRARPAPRKKHTVLLLPSHPVEATELDREARVLEIGLERSGFKDHFELVTRRPTEPLELHNILRFMKPTVVQFSSPGGQDGLYLQSPGRGAYLVTPAVLAEVFRAADASVRLVVLNACFNGSQAGALLAQVGCVVGLGGALPPDATRSFVLGFYGALGNCKSVAAAYKQGRSEMGIKVPKAPTDLYMHLWLRQDVEARQLVLASEPD